MFKWLAFIPLLSLVGCATPEAKFDVLTQSDNFEIRRYQPRIIAQTVVDASYDDAPNAGFRILADYIFGKNTTSTSIEMTAPVDVAAAPKTSGSSIEMTAPVEVAAMDTAGMRYVITFTMPEKYTLASLPKPTDSRITISQMPPKKYAALRFSGYTDASKVESRTRELRDYMNANQLTATGAIPILARYDPPWTLPFFRRNEILIEIRD
jgi:hypothetical protein